MKELSCERLYRLLRRTASQPPVLPPIDVVSNMRDGAVNERTSIIVISRALAFTEYPTSDESATIYSSMQLPQDVQDWLLHYADAEHCVRILVDLYPEAVFVLKMEGKDEFGSLSVREELRRMHLMANYPDTRKPTGDKDE